MSSKVRGFALIELAIALALLSIITSVGLTQYQEYLRTRLARAQGEQIKAVNDVVSSYTTNYFNEIVTGAAITGVADPLAPTVAELSALMNVSMSSTNLYGGGFGIQLELAPAACAPPACAIQGIVHLTAPMTAGGVVDYSLLGEAVLAAGANAGYSMPATPSTISGYGGAWTRTNPVGATAGILAIRNGFDSLALDKFLRRDGTRPMTGSLNMDGNAIRQALTVELTSVVTAGDACPTNGVIARNTDGAVMACQSGRWKKQGSVWEDPVSTITDLPACDATTLGQTRAVFNPSVGVGVRAYTCDGSAWQALAVEDNGNIRVDGTATINKLDGTLEVVPAATIGTVCSPNGSLARTTEGILLSCQSGTWQLAGGGVTQTKLAIVRSGEMPRVCTSSYYVPAHTYSVDASTYNGGGVTIYIYAGGYYSTDGTPNTAVAVRAIDTYGVTTAYCANGPTTSSTTSCSYGDNTGGPFITGSVALDAFNGLTGTVQYGNMRFGSWVDGPFSTNCSQAWTVPYSVLYGPG